MRVDVAPVPAPHEVADLMNAVDFVVIVGRLSLLDLSTIEAAPARPAVRYDVAAVGRRVSSA